jgi:hypothetical protein
MLGISYISSAAGLVGLVSLKLGTVGTSVGPEETQTYVQSGTDTEKVFGIGFGSLFMLYFAWTLFRNRILRAEVYAMRTQNNSLILDAAAADKQAALLAQMAAAEAPATNEEEQAALALDTHAL